MRSKRREAQEHKRMEGSTRGSRQAIIERREARDAEEKQEKKERNRREKRELEGERASHRRQDGST